MLPNKLPKPSLQSEESAVLWSIFNSIQQISIVLRNSPIVKLETQNKFGDKQLHQDVHCDEIVEQHLRLNSQVTGFASEERPHYIEIEREAKSQAKHQYIVTYDPLDGSSIIDTNFTVGSIFSIWPYHGNELIGSKLSEQTNAILALYGPRTTAIYFNKTENKVQQLTLIQNQWFLSHQHLVIAPKTKMFSPGNLRAASDNQKYRKVVQTWIDKEYTLRYTGGLVPDIQQIFVKGHGIFANLQSAKHKAKLRVLYEVAAVGYLIEKAQGSTVTKGKISLMEYSIKTFDDRIPFACGSRDQIKQVLWDLF